ncbi:Sec23-binding domain of Sec16-domain-containing protein [Neurospora hispaniola]|uniref:Protein transport protein sec16 n=1 Tax=Neurospora hispaniola TaxID=588809 RepID=A0AAJ0IFD7_9PEZI|nr:Sec23-binding domain of Sec16-domain-containing protein [Neurospora hispaniola]
MASWNPAFMPKSAADLPAPLPTDNTVADTTDHANRVAQDGSDFWGIDGGEEDVPAQNGASDSWFPDYGTGNHTTLPATDAQATSQITSETDTNTPDTATEQTETAHVTTEDAEAVEPAPTQTDEAPEPIAENAQTTKAVPEDAATADLAPEHAEPTDATTTEKADTDEPSDVASKHTSTMSFTRTIPHEPSWSDDGDPEWNLARADTDPFKFLPSSDRTNSFPPVPPLEQHEQQQEEQQENQQVQQVEQQQQPQTEPHLEQLPIVQPQVANFLGDGDEVEVQGDDGFFSQLSEAQNDGFDQFGAQDENNSQQYMGGDLGAKATEALDARFEEGVPLIAHDGNTTAEREDTKDLFGGEDANDEDDFFSQVQQGTANQTEFEAQPLERKSTMQVLGAMDMGSVQPNFPPVEEQPEKEADATVETQTHDHPETTSADLNTGEGHEEQKPAGEDVEAKWKELFADDEEDTLSLLDDSTEASNEIKEKEIDPAAFFGSDDEGFLDDSEEFPTMEETTQPSAPSVAGSNTTTTPTTRYMPQTQTPSLSLSGAPNPYAPTAPPLTSAPSNPYFPAAPSTVAQTPSVTPFGAPVSAPPPSGRFGYGAVPPPQIERKAQSFVDKKGGYQSPYDLPMEVVKVKKRPSTATLNKPVTAPAAPPPSKSATHLPPPPPTSVPHSSQPGVKPPPPRGEAKPKDKFFEELPVVTKARPASRNTMGTASPAQSSPYGPPPSAGPPSIASQPPVPGMPSAMGSVPNSSFTQHAEIPNLVAPPRVNPYASIQSSTTSLAPAVPAPASSRYSPAPSSGSQLSTPVPPAAASRYSPAPPASRPTSSGYTPTTSVPPVLPPVLPHQPRTSSPLAHFESRPLVSSHAESGLAEKRSSNSLYDLRLQRVPSLPPTQEVEEEGPMQGMVSPNQVPASHQTSPTASRHGAVPHRSRRTPPPQSLTVQPVTSPQRAAYSYQPAASAPSHEFAPPPRSQTQSPGALYGNRNVKPIEPIPRPSSVTDATSPRAALYSPITMQPSSTFPPISTTTSRPRGNTQNFNLVPPTDGREHDPLQRWRGVPLISWGVGGALVTMFPKNVPRYGMGQTAPMVIRSPGEVKVKSMKDIEPMEERLAKFPGPLKGKSKKKETIAWLTNGIEMLERTVPHNLSHQLNPSHDDKRTTERLLLWKILRVFVEHDGVLEGNPTVNQAVREILYPEASTIGGQPEFTNALNPSGLGNSATTSLQADSVDSSAVEQIRNHLISGDNEKAVWAAVDKRLWGHAFLLANALNPDLYKRVAQEFVKNEVNSTGHNNESLAALYDVLSGNHEESVDELVPAHARAGLQLVAKNSSSGPSKDAMGGLDKWRETLSLILSNRTADDARAINFLGNLLSGYGRAEAAHICFLFARSQTIFGGLDNPNSNFVLVGSDHRRQADHFAKEIEPLLLSEVYEYGQSLAGGTVPVSNPHLAAYKLQHAYALAEYGFRDKALQYCEAITAAITAQTKRSPYYHPILEAYVDDLMKRLKQAPKEESNSWIPKPSMNKVSDSMWNRFNKFVAGDDNEDGSKGSPDAAGESGPFARIAGGTPTISRSPSVNNLETFGATIPSYGMPSAPVTNGPNMFSPPPPTRTASRYAPGAPQPSTPNYNPYETNSPYAPRSSMERASGEYSRSSVELPRQSLDSQRGYSHSSYAPNRTSSPAQPYTPYGTTPQESSYSLHNMQPQQSLTSPAATTSGYQPFTPQNNVSANDEPSNEPPSAPSTGYQPPSYGYEPPSFTPYEAPATNDEEEGASKENGDSNQGGEGVNTFEPPSFQPYSYEPPSYEPDTPPSKDDDESEEEKPKPKKKGPMYDDDDDDFPAAPKPAGKSKAEIDRENEEMVRRIAEEEAKRAAEAKATKKGWGFTSWFAKKEAAAADANAAGSSPGKPIRAKLGEANSFYYDPEQKRWINKNASPEDQAAKKSTPPPPKGGIPRSSASSPAPPMGMGVGGGSAPNTPGRASAPPTGPPRPAALMPSASENNVGSGPPSAVGPLSPSGSNGPPSAGLLSPGMGPAAMQRPASASTSAPPAGTSKPLSATSSIDDLLGAAVPRKRGEAKKPRKAARYVDVMQK